MKKFTKNQMEGAANVDGIGNPFATQPTHTPPWTAGPIRDMGTYNEVIIDANTHIVVCRPQMGRIGANRDVAAVAEKIVRAVNAHEELLAAMRKAVRDIESAMNTHTFPPSCGIPMENAKVVLELAIAEAEGR